MPPNNSAKRAWIVLGAAPGPGTDIRIRPHSDLIFALEPLTEAGETFAMLFYPLRLLSGGVRLSKFKQHCTEFELTFETEWAEEAESL